MIKLACPACHSALEGCTSCPDCGEKYLAPVNGIRRLVPATVRRDSRYLAELNRYVSIANQSPKTYSGYTQSDPEYRTKIMRELLDELRVNELVEVGPGFGELQRACADLQIWAVDSCLKFLLKLPVGNHGKSVEGVAEYLPFATDSVPCLIADSVFQSVVDRVRFLHEIGRVVSPDGYIILTIAHRWNYPRKPQDGFNILIRNERGVLVRFLEELGFSVELRWLRFFWGWQPKWNSDMLYVIGHRW